MDRSFCPPNFGINPLIKLPHGKTPHICMHTLWHEHIARATTECTGIAIERRQYTTWLSQCVPFRVCNSCNLISFLKITDVGKGKRYIENILYVIMNTQRIRKLVKYQDVWELTKQIFLFCSPSAYAIEKGVCVCTNSVCRYWPWHCSHEIWCWLRQRRYFLSVAFIV